MTDSTSEIILKQFSPFENHKQSHDTSEIKNLLNFSNYNSYQHQDFVFRQINGNDKYGKNEIFSEIGFFLIKNHNTWDNINIFLRFLVKSKEIIKKLESSYSGYDINFLEIFYKDFIKICMFDKNFKFIENVLENNVQLRNIVLKTFSNICSKSRKYNKQLKKCILEKFLSNKTNYFEDKNQRAVLNNFYKGLNPFIKTEKDIILSKYLYFYKYIETKKIISYDYLVKNFISLFQQSEDNIEYIKEYFIKILENKSLALNGNNDNYNDFSFALIFGTFINVYKNLNNFNNNFNFWFTKNLEDFYLTDKFMEYLVISFHTNLLSSDMNTNFYLEIITNLFSILENKEKPWYKDFYKKINEAKKIIIQKYSKYLLQRYIYNSNFNLTEEEDYIKKLFILEVNDNGKLNQILNDIKLSIGLNDNIQKLKLVSKDNSEEEIKLDLKKLKTTYLTKFTSNNNKEHVSLKSFDVPDVLSKYTKIGKYFFENSVKIHDIIVEVNPNLGYIDFNASINNKNIRIICNYLEFLVLSEFKSLKTTIIGNEHNKKILVKLYLADLLLMKDEDTFQLNINCQKKEVNLFNYEYNIKVKNKLKIQEKTFNEKVLITQAYLVKYTKANSDIYNNFEDCYKKLLLRTNKYFKLNINIFIKTLKDLCEREYIKIRYYKNDYYHIGESTMYLIDMFKYCDIFPSIEKFCEKRELFANQPDSFKDKIKEFCDINKIIEKVEIKYLV